MALVSVIGATGRQGMAQVRQLSNAGHKIRVLSRNPNPYVGDTNAEVENRYFDLEDESTIRPAFEGSDAVFYTHPLQMRRDRVAVAKMLGAAGKDVGLERLVWNTSSWIPDRPGEPFTYGANTQAINELFRSGVPATIFGSVIFMDNLLTNWARPFIVHEGRYVYAHNPHLQSNWISLDDVGKIMTHALERPDMEGAWYNIGGPERLKPPEVAQILTETLGHEVKYDPCTPEEFGRLLVKAFGDDMPEAHREEMAVGIAAFYTYNNEAPTRPFEVNTEYQREVMPDIELETMREWAKRQDWSDEAYRPPAG